MQCHRAKLLECLRVQKAEGEHLLGMLASAELRRPAETSDGSPFGAMLNILPFGSDILIIFPSRIRFPPGRTRTTK